MDAEFGIPAEGSPSMAKVTGAIPSTATVQGAIRRWPMVIGMWKCKMVTIPQRLASGIRISAAEMPDYQRIQSSMKQLSDN